MNTLPYGGRTPWWARVLVFTSYALPSLAISLDLWWLRMAVCALMLILWFALSRLVNALSHKLWEAQAGLCQAATVIMAC